MNILQKKYGAIKSLRSNYFELGRSLLALKKYSLAENAFLNAIEEEDGKPLDWGLKYYLGECYEQQDRPIEAIKSYFEGLLLDAGNGSLLFDKINALVTNKAIAKSVLDWMEMRPDLFEDKHGKHFTQELHIMRGNMHRLADNLDLSYDSFKAIPDNAPAPQRVKALTGLGQIHLLKGDYVQAKANLELAISLQDSKNINPLLQLLEVKVLLALDDKEHAQKDLDIIVNKLGISQMPADLKIMTSGFYLELCNWERVIEITGMLKTGEYNELAYKQRIEGLIALYRYEDASKFADIALQKYPLDNHIFFLKIQCLIEGQLDIKRGVSLFTEMYAQETDTEQIQKELVTSFRRRGEDVNANFFMAFSYFLIKEDEHIIKQHLDKVRGGLKAGINATEESAKRGTYPSKAINVLDGLIFEEKGLTEKAYAEFYEAGKKFYWEADYKNAIVYLKKTVNLNPNKVQVYWHLADALKIISSMRERPYTDPVILEEAYTVWDSRPKSYSVEDPNDYWGYLVGSRIHELRNKFIAEESLAEYWKALLLVERALTHKKDSNVAWTDLGKSYTNLGLYKNSYHALLKAISLNKNDTFTQEEYIRALLNLHKFDEAREYLNDLDKSGYAYRSWYGFIAFMEGDYKKSIDYFNTHMQKYPDDIWSLGMKMNAYWLDFDYSKAREIARTIMSYSDDETIKGQEETFISAIFVLGDIKEAVKKMEEAVKKAGNSYYMNSLQSQLYLYDNQLEKAEEQFDNHLKTEFRVEALNYLFKQLEVLKQTSEEERSENHSALLKHIDDKKSGWSARLKAKIKELDPSELTPEYELRISLEHGGHKKGSPAWIALQAAMARLDWEQGHYADAYCKYLKLRSFQEEFPDVHTALTSILKAFTRAKDKEIKDQKFELVIQDLANSGIETPEIGVRLMIAYLGLNELDNAINQLTKSIKKTSIPNDQDANYPFIETAIDIIPNHKVAWALFDLLKSYQKDHPEFTQGEAIQLENSINQYWSRIMDKSETQDRISVLEPIAIEISQELYPEVPDSEWEFLNKGVKELRDTLKEQFGIHMPGVKIRINNSLLDLSYNILINEVPMTSGFLEKNMVFVPNNIGALDEHSIPYKVTPHPLQGTTAAWVSTAFESELLDKNIEFWKDPFNYLKAHFQYIILSNLDYFFDVQYTYNYLLDTKKEVPKVADVSNKIISNRSLLLTFNRVLKGLLRERVPILEKENILNVFNQKGLSGKESNKIIERIRLEIKLSLPGNTPQLKRIELPKNIEKLVLENLEVVDQKTFLRLDPVICQSSLVEIRELIANENTMACVLVVSDTGLRYYIRKLVELEHADLMVLAKEEIISGE